jgi:hypothetical protein
MFSVVDVPVGQFSAMNVHPNHNFEFLKIIGKIRVIIEKIIENK